MMYLRGRYHPFVSEPTLQPRKPSGVAALLRFVDDGASQRQEAAAKVID